MNIFDLVEGFVYIFIGLPLCLLFGIFIHESGHLLYGMMNGFQFNLLVVGPIGFRSVEGKTKVYFESNKSYWGGISLTLPTNDDDNNIDIFTKILIAGPLFSMIVGMSIIIISILFKSFLCAVLGITVFSFFISTILPIETQMFYTDGMRYRILKKQDIYSFEEYAIIKITFNFVVNNSYLHVDLSDINTLIKSDKAKNRYLGTCYQYLLCKEQGDDDAAQIAFNEMKELEKYVPAKFVEIMMPGNN